MWNPYITKPEGCICVNRPGDASSCRVHSPRQAIYPGTEHKCVFESFGWGPHLHLRCVRCERYKDIEEFSNARTNA